MNKNNNSGTGFFNVMKSAMSAAFGVQSSKNRERDFANGKAIHFIVAGVLITLIFLVFIRLMVELMMSSAA